MVYVQDINGKPMMPTTRHGKVRRLLKDKKAVVVNLCPFTIKYYFIFARRKTGSFNIRDIDGKNQRDITYKKLKLSRCKRFMVQKEMD